MGKKAREQRRAAQRAVRVVMSKAEQMMETLVRDAKDPDHPVDDIARGLLGLYRGRPADVETVFYVAKEMAPARAQALADAALTAAPGSIEALTLAAGVAEALRDDARCVDLYRQAVQVSPDPETRWLYAIALQAVERHAEALAVIEGMIFDDPFDVNAQDLLMDVLRDQPDLPWVQTFHDRGGVYDLRSRIDAFAQRGRATRFLSIAGTQWAEAMGGPPRNEGEAKIFGDWAVGVIDEDTDDDDDTCVLSLYADDPLTPPAARDRALDWLKHGVWGLWQMRVPDSRPGVRLVELCTGAVVYAAIPDEQREGLAPWSVIFGLLVPEGGIWRTGGAFVSIDPRTADAVVRRIFDLCGGVVGGLSGRRHGVPYDPYDGLPPTAAAGRSRPTDPGARRLIQLDLRASVPRILALIDSMQQAPPTLRNTDGDPLLFVTAEIQVSDVEALRERLAAHPDFDAGFDAGDDQVVWLGRVMTASEAATVEAEFKAMLKAKGLTAPRQKGPRRYTRGTIDVNGSTLRVQVNSKERAARLVEVLAELGLEPKLMSQVVADPVQDLGVGLPRSAPPVAEGSGSRAGIEAWQKAWVHESVPALEGMTPMQAVKDERGRVLLEALLREFEHRGALSGGESPDIEELRGTLGMF